MQKHFFFDLDNTLTRSRTHIAPEDAPILKALSERADVIVVSGGQRTQINAQLDPEVAGGYFVLGQNGNEAVHKNGTTLWLNKPDEVQKNAILELIEKMQHHLALEVKDVNDLVEDRGCSIAYSTIGHHEDVATKENYDPDHRKRLALLASLDEDVRMLRDTYGIEVRTGGTTCLDFFLAGRNKGSNIASLLKTLSWQTEECLYIGDALFEGGNDFTVVGIIPTQSVQDYHETYTFLTTILQN